MTSLARNYQEKRDFIRMQVSAPAVLTLDNGNNVELTCLDLSSSGVQLQHFEPLPVNIAGTLVISSGGGYTNPLEARITVCRVQQLGADEYRIGAVIDNLL
ncbi:MAG: PilZ domain-containing protein [Oceanospirillaceae bacterium]|nr:PilZ domain-containing protein [Oceanospirillaceae bacterium]MBT11137.1 PilZ domain-containing protein [Oceanospirillaceae bacterium]|tara:strand:+ start:14486 stop:14788 length:303 start_codon:yes stop_codon:yes gene_type:complete